MSDLTVLELIAMVVMALVFLGPFMFMIVMKELGITADTIRSYLEERERQKTIRKLVEVQRDREALGVAEERSLFEGHDSKRPRVG